MENTERREEDKEDKIERPMRLRVEIKGWDKI